MALQTEKLFAISPAQEEQLARSFDETPFAQVIRAAGIDESKISRIGEVLQPVYFSLEKASGVFRIVNIDLVKGVQLEASRGEDSIFHGGFLSFYGATWDSFGELRESTEFMFDSDKDFHDSSVASN